MKKQSHNKGFSLVELIVTIAIMAVLVGILSPSLLRYVEKTRESRDAAAVGEFINELYLAASDLDNYNDMPRMQTFQYDSAAKKLKTTPDEGANSFSREVAAIVGGDIKLESQKFQAANLKILVSPVWDTIHVSGNIPAGYDFNNCTIVP